MLDLHQLLSGGLVSEPPSPPSCAEHAAFHLLGLSVINTCQQTHEHLPLLQLHILTVIIRHSSSMDFLCVCVCVLVGVCVQIARGLHA